MSSWCQLMPCQAWSASSYLSLNSKPFFLNWIQRKLQFGLFDHLATKLRELCGTLASLEALCTPGRSNQLRRKPLTQAGRLGGWVKTKNTLLPLLCAPDKANVHVKSHQSKLCWKLSLISNENLPQLWDLKTFLRYFFKQQVWNCPYEN